MKTYDINPVVREKKIPQHLPVDENISPMEMAVLELEETADLAILDTMEEIGMLLGDRVRENKKKLDSERNSQRMKILLSMVQRMQDEYSNDMQSFISQNSVDSDEVTLARNILALSFALTDRTLSKEKRRSLTRKLSSLMDQGEWEIELFGMMELKQLDKSALMPLRRLFREAISKEELSLTEWFRRVRQWPERRARVRVLIRSMAFELSVCMWGEQQLRLASVLVRLRRLLLFFSMESECHREEEMLQLPRDTMLTLLIDIISESWVFDNWLLQRLKPLTTTKQGFNLLRYHLDALFSVLPDLCFSDNEQREQIRTALQNLK